MRLRYLYLVLPVLFMFSCKEKAKRLPYLQQEIVENEVDGKIVPDTSYRTIPAFKFLNQDSGVVTSKDFDGAIYVADFFFTSCPFICPIMHRNLLKVYRKYLNNPEVKLASHTIDAKYDSPSRLKAYADKLGVKGTQWEFIWGKKEDIYAIAERNYLVSVRQDKNGPGGFIHAGYLMLIDKNKRLRGAYDGTSDSDVKKLMEDMDTLLAEYKK
jgi:protein SCO1/2